MWTTITAIPTFISFLWQWRDRRGTKLNKPILVDIVEMANYEFYFRPDDFAPVKITLRNDNPFSVILVEVALTNVKAGKIAVGKSDPSTVTKLYSLGWNTEKPLNKDVYMPLPPAFEERGRVIKTGTAEFDGVFFISHDTIRASNNTLDFCLTFQTTGQRKTIKKVYVTGVLFEHWRKPKEGNPLMVSFI